ncbi:hypothetical protein IL306_000363, partial [Fusarium sp. DS 682]
MSSTSPYLDVHFTTRAVLEWQLDNTTRILAKPDPKVSSIEITARFDSSSELFDIRIPLKLKGLDTTSHITLRICASSIISLNLVKNPTVTTEVEQVLKSTALGLRFELNSHLDVLVPTPALDPISAGRANSGAVLDAVREFAQSAAFTIYIEARDAPPTFQPISDAVGEGHFRLSRSSSRFQLASMYAGLGAKIVRLDVNDAPLPPSYQEIEPPPPPPPIQHKPDRKRPRQDTQTHRVSDGALIWAELRILQQAKAEDRKRIAVLETENKKLREAIGELQAQNAALRKSHQDLGYDFGALETAVKENTESFEESVDSDLAELREDISELKKQFSDDKVAELRDVVLQEIATRLSAT